MATQGEIISVKRDELPIFFVDAFTDKSFSGNPAAVCLISREKDSSDETMQNIASEMNLSETAFVECQTSCCSFLESDTFNLRWFTPTNEVPLCGHATLASAAVLYNQIGNKSEELTFKTLSGALKAKKCDNYFSLDLPLNECVKQERNEIEKLLELVVGSLDVLDLQYSPKTKKLLIRLEDNVTRSVLEDLNPALDRLPQVACDGSIKGVMVTVKGSIENGCFDQNGIKYDFVSRYFAPWNGIPEDPVTGSAHTVLASYWSKELQKRDLYARQCSSRGGDLKIKIKDGGRVDIAGPAKITLKGVLTI